MEKLRLHLQQSLQEFPTKRDERQTRSRKVEFPHIPRAEGWEVHEIEALLGGREQLHVILRL